MRMKKEFLDVQILVHPYQSAIVKQLRAGKINLQQDTLREIGTKIGLKNKSTAQIIKHHLEILVKYGIVQKIYGEYIFLPKRIKLKPFGVQATE